MAAIFVFAAMFMGPQLSIKQSVNCLVGFFCSCFNRHFGISGYYQWQWAVNPHDVQLDSVWK